MDRNRNWFQKESGWVTRGAPGAEIVAFRPGGGCA